ncbi:MAG: hypothetical protein WEB30_07185 [Cyclobacteriaceae bacterium]
MGKKYSLLTLNFVTICLTGCYYLEQPDSYTNRIVDTTRVDGYIPVYGTSEYQDIAVKESRPVVDPGKIYVYGKYLLVNEKKKGIHVFDNSNPGEPVGVGFLQLLGNTDMAIKDGLLYADYMGNLVALTINDFKSIEENGRLPLRNWNYGLPPPPGFHFECIDPGKGLVVSWKKEKLLNPGCYAIQ